MSLFDQDIKRLIHSILAEGASKRGLHNLLTESCGGNACGNSSDSSYLGSCIGGGCGSSNDYEYSGGCGSGCSISSNRNTEYFNYRDYLNGNFASRRKDEDDFESYIDEHYYRYVQPGNKIHTGTKYDKRANEAFIPMLETISRQYENDAKSYTVDPRLFSLSIVYLKKSGIHVEPDIEAKRNSRKISKKIAFKLFKYLHLAIQQIIDKTSE